MYKPSFPVVSWFLKLVKTLSNFSLGQALAHKTLVLLLGVDPSKQLDHPLPTASPHVTYAYMKYMWKSARTVKSKNTLALSCTI